MQKVFWIKCDFSSEFFSIYESCKKYFVFYLKKCIKKKILYLFKKLYRTHLDGNTKNIPQRKQNTNSKKVFFIQTP